MLLIGLMGQFAWTIENMYFNVFLYNTITTDPNYIAAMVSASAIAATLTTLLMGAVSDRVGRRKAFICVGYLLWGAATASFGFITVENAARLLPGVTAVSAAAMLVIVMDCVMTFFGSTANDAAFNAYITDQIPDEQRGKVESVLAILPLLSMLIIFGLFDGMTQAGRWQEFFLIFGALVTIAGLVCCFLLPEEPRRPRREPFLAQLVDGFRPSVIRKNKALYLSLAGMCVFSIAVQVFFPYLIIYMQHYLKLDNYAIVLGSVLLVASAATLIFGRFIDRFGKLRFAVPAAAVMFIGLIAMYFARSIAWVIPCGMVMMSGYMLLSSALGAQMRELTPEDQAGHFQGIRMIFSVMVPMIVGPFIGAALIRDGGATYVDLGQVKTVPTPTIFLGAAALLVLLAIPLGLLSRELKRARMEKVSQPLGLKTPWGENINPEAPLQEYPRPQFRRDSYLNLNGVWEYAITDNDELPARFDGTIVVPFSPESILSGVGRTLLPHQTLWCRRQITLPEDFVIDGGTVLVHFGAVDQEATVYWNGCQVAHHMGGYTAFSADVTDMLANENTLLVRVHDDTDRSYHSRGKQKTQRGGIWYTPQSGIWQTVWMESLPLVHMQNARIEPLYDESSIRLTVNGTPEVEGSALIEGKSHSFVCGQPLTVQLSDFRAWSPEDPYLYPIMLTLGSDHAETYFAMRKTEVRKDESGVVRLFLNNKPYFHNGLLDQGYWPDGLLTPPADEAMICDIQTAKDLGYNMLRKHIKIEPMRWYYHCDRIGMLVWQDMMNGGGEYSFWTISTPLVTGIHQKDNQYRKFARSDAAGRKEYARELKELITQLINVPSIVLWVPFNEGWGQFDAKAACDLILKLDKTRPIDHASGWHDQKFGDIQSLHVYFKPYKFRPDKLGRAVVLSEFGGYNLRLEGHTFNSVDFGYKKFADQNALWNAYRDLYEQQILPAIPNGLAATVYTQLTDVEDELNGILTYDRRVVKLPAEELKALNERVNG
ncbi:MAG: MFS transporter [Clostridia bacterium]|nr:MFS transporter [Clostridia bacterium]